MTFNADIRVTEFSTFVGGYAGKFTMQKPIRDAYGLGPGHQNRVYYKSDSEWFPDKDTASRPTEMEILWTRGGPVRQYEFNYGQTQAIAREYDYKATRYQFLSTKHLKSVSTGLFTTLLQTN